MKRFLTVLQRCSRGAWARGPRRGGGAPGASWSASVPFTNVVASSPTTGGGYPVPPGSRVPEAGTCREGPFNANHSESWLAVKPGTEDLVGTSKFFFDKYSTFYMFYLGAYQILGRDAVRQQPGPGLRLHLDRHAGHAAELDRHDRPQRRLRHQGPRLPDDAAVQLVLRRDEAASGRRDRRVLQRRPGPPLGEGQRRRAARAAEQRLGEAGRARRGQAMDRRQPHRRQPVPGPRLRGLGGLQRQRRRDQGADGGLPRPRPDLRQGGHDHPAVRRSAPGATYVYPEIDAAGQRLRLGRLVPAERRTRSTIYVARSTDDARHVQRRSSRSRP